MQLHFSRSALEVAAKVLALQIARSALNNQFKATICKSLASNLPPPTSQCPSSLPSSSSRTSQSSSPGPKKGYTFKPPSQSTWQFYEQIMNLILFEAWVSDKQFRIDLSNTNAADTASHC